MESKGIMNDKLLLFIFIIFFTIDINAQILVKGNVQDSLNQGIPFVNIYTKQADISAILAFGNSNDKGYFAFETPAISSFYITASALGYESQTLKIDNNDKKVVEINFTLYPKEYDLKETIVRGSNKIIQKSDTITFNADKFRDSTERNLEELLAKIPGLDVDKNTGVISVQGKPIKKILIEGDDLTGRNYQLMSQNMSADVVDKIQIIDRFTENKLLKGLKRSDDKVINITLKENRKKLLFGNVLGGIGNDERTNNSLNLFGFYKKLKTISFGNFNTIGQISTADRMLGMDFTEETESENQRSLLKSRNSTIIDIGRTPSVSLSSQSVRFNKAALGSTHFVIRPIESLSVKGIMTVSQDRVRSFVNNEYTYLLQDSLFSLNEINTIERQPTLIEGHLDVQMDVNEKSSWRYKGDFRKSITENSAITLANTNRIENKLQNRILSFANRLDFTHRLKDNQALTLNITFINDKQTQGLDINQNQARLTPSVFLPTDRLFQDIRKPIGFYSASGQWLFSKKTLQFSTYLGSVFRKEDFNSQMTAEFKNSSIVLPDSFQNQFLYSQKNYYGGINIKEEWLGIQWLSDISSGYFENTIENRMSKKGFYCLPTLGFKKKMNERQMLFGTYAYNFALPQAIDISNGFILTDYRSVERGSSFFIPANSHTGILNFTNGNFNDEFLWHINILHTNNFKGYRSSFSINADFNGVEKVENDFTARNTIFVGSIEKYMPSLYIRFKMRPSLTIGNYPNTLNTSDIRNTNTLNSQIDFSVRSAYLKWFNFHVGTKFNQSNISTRIKDKKTEVKNRSIGSFCDFYLRFNTKFTARLENEIFYFKQQNNNPQKYYFINASTNYDIIKSKLSAGLYAKNMLNTKQFINSFITDYSTQINRIQLLPRYWLIEINYRF